MKKLFLTLALALGVLTVNAQEVGQFWAGGSLGFSMKSIKIENEAITDTKSKSYTSFKFVPEIGYVITENLGVGVNLGYTHVEDVRNYNGIEAPTREDGYLFGAFARYTFLKGDLGSLFVDGGATYSYLEGKRKPFKSETTDLEIGFRPGVAVKLSNTLALTGKLGFLGYKHEKSVLKGVKDSKVRDNSLGFDFDMSQFQFGLSFIF
ncbi:hypothetical protein M2132_000049 [Dysgonomonas sp. PH5-45]|uniref:outer membrane beta-barrel protein n=1 Tax=unclassified Dysgonomonas TaxID=2630389 RepID=UPI0024739D97|nr:MULTISPECIES: outer membrane beta-barrel protein [unclassified Dysgonomonas]MDH6353732.1 hypothetical protein [Dysgonomonas sp. PH5-45]MDH6386635.1 hypothetical protein [Dysgonomonas sp. PH5-37]